MISITTGILDNDNKGKLGRGTKFWLEVKVGENIQKYEYSLMDELDGTFNRKSILAPLLIKAEELQKQEEKRLAEEKKNALQNRQAAVTINPALDTIVNTIIASQERIVNEFKSGKDKVLNSLVGMVMKECKNINLVVDAFAVSTILKNKLPQQGK